MSFGGLSISISGIYANKKALDTVSHNISNVNNPKYTRQNTIHATNRYSSIKGNRIKMGTGVHVEVIRQNRDEFLDFKFRYELEKYGYWDATNDILSEVETIFNKSTNDGLQDVVDEFWDGWDEVFKEPDSLTMRGVLHESAVAFTETVNHIDNQLNNIQLNLNEEIMEEVEDINNILKKIGILNDNIKIKEAEGSHIKANDYRDERNELLDRLSAIMPIKHYEKDTGETVISLQGREILNGDYIQEIGIKKNGKGYADIYWSDKDEEIEFGEKGSLSGYINARDILVEDYRNDLKTLVKTMAEKINTEHIKGKDLEGEKGKDFFIFEGSMIKVNPELSNFNKIAVSKSGDVGDGEIAKEILKIRKEIFNELDDSSFEDYYRDLISDIGIERAKARNITNNQGKLLKQIDDRREAISGISLDEEMADMLRYQHSYIANSRTVNAIDEMLDIVLNRMGIVGR